MSNIIGLEKIKSILRDTKYGIRVTAKENNCTLSLPTKKFSPARKARTINYEILKGGGGVNITGDVDSYWICPDYVIRASIYMDILKKCEEYDYSPLAVLYSNEEYDNANSLLEILPAPEGVKIQSELDSLDLATSVVQSNNINVLVELRQLAEELDLLEGFNFLVTNFCGKVLK